MTPERTNRRVTGGSNGPSADVVWDGGQILVTWPLADIAEEMVRIDLEDTFLVLFAEAKDRQLVQRITVPAGSRIVKKRFFNNILELTLEPPA